ncbi:MAG: hypothetical protein JXD23_06080 [Spirochaetales bacterium]|nr:hypothetical protein [Spirochaetales bacterium]
MKTLEKIATGRGRRDENPNIELAGELAERRDQKGIAEIAAGLRSPNPRVRSDCIKVLYEIGHRDPGLIAAHVDRFAELLRSGQNRMVWGGMAALAAVASVRPREVYRHLEAILAAFEQGSVITVDNGVTVLASLSAADARYEKKLWPLIERHLATCRPKELPQHAERARPAVNRGNVRAFIALLERRLSHVSPVQAKRIEKILSSVRTLEGIKKAAPRRHASRR